MSLLCLGSILSMTMTSYGSWGSYLTVLYLNFHAYYR